jgi:hypothetical protein
VRRNDYTLLGVCLLGLGCLAARAQPSAVGGTENVSGGDAASRLPQITVEAQRARLEHQVYAYVGALTHDALPDEALKRWQDPVCPLVAGLPQAEGEFMLSRISAVARNAGVPLGPEHCRANLYVVVTATPDKLLTMWQHRSKRLFASGSAVQVRDFLGKARPIRVWYNSTFGTSYGTAMNSGAPELGTVFNDVPSNHHFSGSRLVIDDVPLFASVIVVVDVVQVSGLQYGQLADYVAMIGLSQLDLDVKVDAPSILQLFAARSGGEPGPSGLSSWDAAFLRALYATKQGTPMQRSAMASVMLHDIAQ